VHHNSGPRGVEVAGIGDDEFGQTDRGSSRTISIVNHRGAMIKGHTGNHDQDDVEEAAEHAARAVSHRRESQRRAVQAEAEDGPTSEALERSSAEHTEAAHAEENEAGEAAKRADENAS
jgi:hypothetical protein